MLKAAARHLFPDGLLAFDTRNPAAKAWLGWTPAQSAEIAEAPGLGRIEESVDTAFDEVTGIASITHRHRFLDRGGEQIGRSRIRFIDRDRLVGLIERAGLAMEHCFGWWDRRPFTAHSDEMIVLARPRPTGPSQ
jgi:hypothetical protein